MEKWKLIDKERLMIFTDAMFAIIMTILVLDIKVPILTVESNDVLCDRLLKQLPHLYGFAISFAVITVIWFSHHDLFISLKYATRTFTVFNFILIGTIALLPFSTALASEFPDSSLAVALLSGNMFFMNLFLSLMYRHVYVKNIIDLDYRPPHIANIKRLMGFIGLIIFLIAFIFAFISPKLSFGLIVIVPLMHCLPVSRARSASFNKRK